MVSASRNSVLSPGAVGSVLVVAFLAVQVYYLLRLAAHGAERL